MAETVRYYASLTGPTVPPGVLELLEDLAADLAARSWTLRHPALTPADHAMAARAQTAIAFPRADTPALANVARFRGGFTSADHHDQITRRVQAVMGETFREPAAFVLAWTPSASEGGDLELAFTLARRAGLQIINLAYMPDRLRARAMLGRAPLPIGIDNPDTQVGWSGPDAA